MARKVDMGQISLYKWRGECAKVPIFQDVRFNEDIESYRAGNRRNLTPIALTPVPLSENPLDKRSLY